MENYWCGRCGGLGTCCPCCSGFTIDHPQLVGAPLIEGDGRAFPTCPDCGGKGTLTERQLRYLAKWKRDRWAHPRVGTRDRAPDRSKPALCSQKDLQ